MADDIIVNITVGGASISEFSFGIPMFITEHDIGSERQNGPFSTADDLIDFGFTAGDPAYQWATALMSQRPRPRHFMLGRVDGDDPNLAASLAAIAGEGIGSWYASFLESRAIADILALAAFTEPLLKVAIVQSSDADMLTDEPNNDAAQLSALGYHQTALIYHPTDGEFLDGAFGGRGLGADLEQVQGTWNHRTLAGVPGTSLSVPSKTALEANNANYYAPKAMTSGTIVDAYTFPGVMASGRPMEQTISIHWLHSRLEEALHGVFLRAPDGIPFNDAGFALLEAAAQGVFGRGLTAGHLVERTSEFTGRRTPWLDVVALNDVTPGDDASATVRLSGEVHIGKKARRVVLNVVAHV